MAIPYRMIAAALMCSALAACGGDDSGAGVEAAGISTANAASGARVPAAGSSGLSVSAPTAMGGTVAPASAGTVAQTSPTSGSSVAAPTTNPADVVEPSGAAGQPIAAAPSGGGFSTLRVKAYTGPELPTPSDIGSFRLVCGYSHMAFDDPIVFPGKSGASHLHAFFGNTSVDALTTTESLLAAKSSTCAGGIANQSAYWKPALIDTATSRALVPAEYMVYYKKGYNDLTNAEIESPPNGLRMVGGRSATATAAPGKYDPVLARFSCDNSEWSASIPACPAGSKLHMNLAFPNCWDGKNLDSPDHRSHMANARAYTPKRCPASHPHPIPTIELNITYVVEPGANASRYRLASDKYDASLPGGYTFHADVWLAWDEGIKATWMKNCINAGMDCHAFLLGNGQLLY